MCVHCVHVITKINKQRSHGNEKEHGGAYETVLE